MNFLASLGITTTTAAFVAGIAALWIFSAAVGALQAPTQQSSALYTWAYKFLKTIAGDLGSVFGKYLPSISNGTKVMLVLLAAGVALTLCGCPSSTSAVHKASVAAASIGSSLESAATVNHQMLQAGEESAAEASEVAAYIQQAAEANDAFTKTIASLPSTGGQITAQQALAAFATLQTQIATLNQQGVLHLKSQKAQAAFAGIMTTIQGSMAAIEVVIAVQSSRAGVGLIAFAAVALTPEEIEELISLALAAGSALVSKLMQLRGQTDAQLQSTALASDAAAEQQAEADEQK
jgi:hypothetical protein